MLCETAWWGSGVLKLLSIFTEEFSALAFVLDLR